MNSLGDRLIKFRCDRMRGNGNLALFITVSAVLMFSTQTRVHAANAEDTFWKSVVKANVIEEYAIYVKQFPNGRYLVEATRLIDELRERDLLREELSQSKKREEESRIRAIGSIEAQKSKDAEEATVRASRVRSEAKLISYTVAADPSTTLNAGSPMVIRSQITVVEGANTKNQPVVEEQLVVMHDGKSIASARKRANEGYGSGEYWTSFTLNLPAKVPRGFYPVETALFIDGRQVQTRSLSIQVVGP